MSAFKKEGARRFKLKLGKIDKVELSGLIVLFIGVILLACTFYSAFMFLIAKLGILGTGDILKVFGESLAPLIEAVIRILYLGIMGWIGSILTIRGVQLLKKERTEAPPPPQQPKQETKPEAEKPTKVKEAEKTETPSPPPKASTP